MRTTIRQIDVRKLFVLVLACSTLAFGACGDDDQPTASDDKVAVYSAIVGKLLAENPPTTEPSKDGSGHPAATSIVSPTSSEASTASSSRPVTSEGPDATDRPDKTDKKAELPTVYVEPLGDGFVIDLAVQAGVVKNLTPVAEVRFIDNRVEAVQTDEPGQPVKANGMLVGLGPLVEASAVERTAQVRTYVSEDRHVDRLATVTAAGDSWTVVLSDAP